MVAVGGIAGNYSGAASGNSVSGSIVLGNNAVNVGGLFGSAGLNHGAACLQRAVAQSGGAPATSVGGWIVAMNN